MQKGKSGTEFAQMMADRTIVKVKITESCKKAVLSHL